MQINRIYIHTHTCVFQIEMNANQSYPHTYPHMLRAYYYLNMYVHICIIISTYLCTTCAGLLAKAVIRFPAGTQKRWQCIADYLNHMLRLKDLRSKEECIKQYQVVREPGRMDCTAGRQAGRHRAWQSWT